MLPLIATTADYLAKQGMYPSDDAWLTRALKTVDFYQRTMWRAVKDLYDGALTKFAFEDVMIGLIENQLRRAWNEGMRDAGLDPATEMTPAFEEQLQTIILSELSYVSPLANDILTARANQSGYEQFRGRVNVWTNRYNDVVSQARAAATRDNLIWTLGATEHCDTCKALEGIVASADEWRMAGFKPQTDWMGNLPNNHLDCKGYNCGCELQPTTKRRTAKALTLLLDIATGRRV